MLAGLSDAEIWELAQAAAYDLDFALRDEEKAAARFILAHEVRRPRDARPLAGRLINMVSAGEFFGDMAYIWGGELPRHATGDAMTDLLLAEFELAAMEKMSTSAQLHLTRALTRNVVDRLAMANQRLANVR